jgi:acylphosphatase
MLICKRVLYTGRVQGVGFRYTAERLAQGFAVAGYVRNLANGNVEVVAQGEADQVQPFLDAVARRMAGYIQDSTAVDEAPGNYQEFEVRY